MTETPLLSLPLLQAAQAQKHVTMNEALVRLDGLAQLVLKSTSTATPPGLAGEGDCYGVPTSATGAWAGQGGSVALYSNGGWVFVPARAGWRAWIADRPASAVFDGEAWIAGALAISPNGSACLQEVAEFDHQIGVGATSVAVGGLPGGAVVIGVAGRVLQALGGGVTGWKLGVAGSPDRYGSGLGVAAGSWLRGLTGTPITYYAPEDLILTAEGTDFANGSVRLAVHYLRLTLPEP